MSPESRQGSEKGDNEAHLLRFERPIVVFDLETTGTNPGVDRIVEIAAIKIFPDGRSERFVRRVNPKRAIPPSATAIHGIRDEDVRDCPEFREIAPQLADFLRGCDVAGFGVLRFDIPMLREEFRRAGLDFPLADAAVLDALVIFHRKERRNLAAALRFYCDEELEGAHGAEADAEAAWKVLQGQLRRYADLPRDVRGLSEFCGHDPEYLDSARRLRWEGDEVVIAFGEHAGRSLREMASRHPRYLQWILRKRFPDKVKDVVRSALEGRFPSRSQQRDKTGNETPGASGT